MPLSRPRHPKKCKRKLTAPWKKLLESRIEAAVATGDPLQRRPAKGNTCKLYTEGSFSDALRAGEVTLEALLASSEVNASPGTVRKWRKIAAALDKVPSSDLSSL